MRVLSDVHISRILYKTVSNLYKTDQIQQIRNQSENDDIPEEPKYHVTRTPTNGSAVYWSRDSFTVPLSSIFFSLT